MAIKHLNSKNDDHWDNLLPSTKIEFAVYDSKRDNGQAVVNAFNLWKDFQAKVAIGPASSGPSKQSHLVLKLPKIDVPQISYSATSAELSESGSLPMFMRTPPSDSFQAEIMVDIIRNQGWKNVCVLAGTDSYSVKGSESTIYEINKETEGFQKLNLVQFATFEAGASDDSVGAKVQALIDAACPVVILWAQSGDMRSVLREADKRGLSASNVDLPVLWFISEIAIGAFEDFCFHYKLMCQRVFRGSLVVVPNYGPGTASYAKYAKLFHEQQAQVGDVAYDENYSPERRTGSVGCDEARDDANQTIWLRDHDLNPLTPPICSAVDFNDYDLATANANMAESTGDGRVSNYAPCTFVVVVGVVVVVVVPLPSHAPPVAHPITPPTPLIFADAYDALLAVAHGLHSLYTSSEWIAASTDEEIKTLYVKFLFFYHNIVSPSFGLTVLKIIFWFDCILSQ